MALATPLKSWVRFPTGRILGLGVKVPTGRISGLRVKKISPACTTSKAPFACLNFGLFFQPEQYFSLTTIQPEQCFSARFSQVSDQRKVVKAEQVEVYYNLRAILSDWPCPPDLWISYCSILSSQVVTSPIYPSCRSTAMFWHRQPWEKKKIDFSFSRKKKIDAFLCFGPWQGCSLFVQDLELTWL